MRQGDVQAQADLVAQLDFSNCNPKGNFGVKSGQQWYITGNLSLTEHL